MPYTILTNEEIDPAGLRTAVASTDFGAYVTFSGEVREHDGGKRVTSLHYTAYEQLASKELQRIAAEAERRWHGCACAIAHRIGTLGLGECSVVVIVGSTHRMDAFAACLWAIDTVKRDVPIWKQEAFADASVVWIEGDRRIAAEARAEAQPS